MFAAATLAWQRTLALRSSCHCSKRCRCPAERSVVHMAAALALETDAAFVFVGVGVFAHVF
jgi:hypothetical protein